jgi:hypothetical protein
MTSRHGTRLMQRTGDPPDYMPTLLWHKQELAVDSSSLLSSFVQTSFMLLFETVSPTRTRDLDLKNVHST